MRHSITSDDPFTYLRKESLDIYNRLHSIDEDIQFVHRIREVYAHFPILRAESAFGPMLRTLTMILAANLRCGAWYTDPELSEDVPAYFKSTDGHFNNWSFNLRRANLHLLPFLLRHGGLVLVDSTRAGKRMPDALSKTIPIWCAVINRTIALRHQENFQNEKWDVMFYTPPGCVCPQEHHQIEERLSEWAQNLATSSFDLPALPRPLRPFWITPSTSTFPILSSDLDFIPVICVSVSRHTTDGAGRRTAGYTYIQGSGDDHELWGMGLDPQTFWKFKDRLLSSDRSSLSDLVKDVVSQRLTGTGNDDSSYGDGLPCLQRQPTAIARVNGILSITSASTTEVLRLGRKLRSSSHIEARDGVYILMASPEPGGNDKAMNPSGSTGPSQKSGEEIPISLLFTIPEGKRGQLHFLQDVLPRSMSFIRSHLLHDKNNKNFNNNTDRRDVASVLRISCICDSKSGLDRSVGVALAALQLFFNDDGTVKTAADPSGGKVFCAPDRRGLEVFDP